MALLEMLINLFNNFLMIGSFLHLLSLVIFQGIMVMERVTIISVREESIPFQLTFYV